MSRKKTVFRLALGALAAAAVAVSAATDKPVNWHELPEPFHSPSANNPPRVVPMPEDEELQVPEGFEVEEYLSGFDRPRFMLLGPNNEILLSDSGERQEATGKVYVINDGEKKAILEGLDRPYGLAIHKEWLYVGEPASIKRYPYDREAMEVTGEGEEIVSLAGMGRGHWTRTLLFDPKGEKLYFTVGSGSNIDLREPLIRATIARCNPDGTAKEIFAAGLRNTIGLRWHPETGDLWAAVQERDGLGDDLVPDYLVNVKQGGFYGWPYAYIGPHAEPRHEGAAPGMVEKTLYPDVLLGAHVAVLDIFFYSGEQFPEKYRGGLFLAFHGSWNRAKRVGYKIAFIPFEDGKAVSGPQDFLTGWLPGPESQEVWGRPVGLLQLPDGSLLVSDDGAGKIWRITYTR